MSRESKEQNDPINPPLWVFVAMAVGLGFGIASKVGGELEGNKSDKILLLAREGADRKLNTLKSVKAEIDVIDRQARQNGVVTEGSCEVVTILGDAFRMENNKYAEYLRQTFSPMLAYGYYSIYTARGNSLAKDFNIVRESLLNQCIALYQRKPDGISPSQDTRGLGIDLR